MPRPDKSRQNGKKGGRPKGSISDTTLQKQINRDLLVKTASDHYLPMLLAQIDLAKGVFVEVPAPDGSGNVKVYKKLPDTSAFKIIQDQLIGKPKETIDAKIDINEIDILSKNSKAKMLKYKAKPIKIQPPTETDTEAKPIKQVLKKQQPKAKPINNYVIIKKASKANNV